MLIYELTDTFDFGAVRSLTANTQAIFTSSSGVTAAFFSNKEGHVVADPTGTPSSWLQMTKDGEKSHKSSFFIPKKINSRSIFKVEFDFYLSNGSGSDPADGFSFNYGDFQEDGTPPSEWHSRYWSEPEHGSAGQQAQKNLSFEFDTYGSGAGGKGAGVRIREVPPAGSGSSGAHILDEELWTPTNSNFEGWGKIIISYGGATRLPTYDITWEKAPSSPPTFILNGENATTLTASTIPKIAIDDNDFGFLLHARTGGSNQTFSFGNFKLYTGEPAPADICFPAGIPVTTDQGPIAIEKLIPGTHTIKEKPIVGISQTKSSDDHLLCFEKHALGHNIPNQQTIMSREHCILYKGKMKRACTFMRYARIRKIKYTGEALYNVMLEKPNSMVVNNMTVETLHPKHWVAKKILKK